MRGLSKAIQHYADVV